MQVSRAVVRQVALVARLDLSPREEAELVVHFEKVLTYMDKLNMLATAGVEPTAHAVAVPSPLREDRVTNMAAVEAMLQNAPAREANFFKVPKIID